MAEQSRTGRGRTRLTATVTDLAVVQQRAFLIAVAQSKGAVLETQTSLNELALLTDTAGSEPVDEELVRRERFDAATLIGSGKVDELVSLTKAQDIDVVIFDNELSPAQQRNLQQRFECDVVDRVALILDIFAQHATSKEGMLQVELAQLRYRLPRLRGRGTEMSRLGGGIGTRGPGETQLETDRRRILERISKLERELKHLARSRDTRTKARRKSRLPVVSLVGYTNAGKSTLFNHLTDAGVLVEDRLFATLDSTIRRLDLPTGVPILMSDTVGFVRNLPHQLVEAFRSTLEEVNQADLLLHIIDGADLNPDRQIAAVRSVLGEIGASDIPEQLIINKTDIADPVAINRLLQLHPEAVATSAVTGDGVAELGTAVTARLAETTDELELTVPYDRGDMVAMIHEIGHVLTTDHTEAGTKLTAQIPSTEAHRFAEFVNDAANP
ncbi:MAG: GTPase HflX [bacterium]|nr:GTPase HflX [bacterium]MCP4966659.1 GTPase HflX [bacterium]